MTSDAIVIADAGDGRLLDANNQALSMLHLDAEGLLGLNILDLHPESEHEAVRQVFMGDQNSLVSEFLECRILPLRGLAIPCELSAQRITQDGRVLAIGIYRDISDRIRALEDINLRNVAIASFSSGVTIADARQQDLPLIYVNRGFEELTGFKAKEAVGRSCRFLQADDRDQEQLEVLRRALKKGESCVVRLRNYRKDGSLFHNELHMSPVRNEQGELTHFVGIQIDVTDRVRNRELLASSERRYRLLADSVEDLITRRKQSGELEFASSTTEDLLGIPAKQWIGNNFYDWVHPEDRESLQAISIRAFAGESVAAIRFRIRHKDGHYIWLESRDSLSEPLETGGAPLLVSVSRDVTLQRKAEEDIRTALEKEKELNEIKTRFISMVSHEFRTPMTSIQASTALLRDFSAGLSKEKIASHYRNIDTALKRMAQMLNDVLFVSRSESAKVPCNPRSIHLVEYCQELIETLKIIEPQAEIIFRYTIPEGGYYLLDPSLLNHIFQNLLGNALKYSRRGDKVEWDVSTSGPDLEFVITDHGIGIPQEDQAGLFEAFYRARNVGTIRGTGLGLNIAYRSAGLMGGSMEFRSEEGKGTVFTVRLPAKAANSTRQ
jgi:PAS domain S-box-containing protein